jgi:hypothetical protein
MRSNRRLALSALTAITFMSPALRTQVSNENTQVRSVPLSTPSSRGVLAADRRSSAQPAPPKLIVSAMAYAAPRTHVPLEAPRTLPTHNPAALVANSAVVVAAARTYQVTLKDCSPPLPLNSRAMSSPSGSCNFQMALFGSFGARAYRSGEAALAALATQIVTDERPFSECTAKSRVQLADGIASTVSTWGPASGEAGPCQATWQARDWTFIISGMTPDLWVGGPWTTTANQIIAYVASHALPGRGEMVAVNAGDGLITTLTWASGPVEYNTFAYHGALPAVEMAAAMAPYPGD